MTVDRTDSPAVRGPINAVGALAFPRSPPAKWVRNLVVAALVGFTVACWVSDLLMPTLIPEHPLVLLILNDRVRTYPLASPHMDSLGFYSIGVLRLAAPYPLYFLLGRWYGDAGVRWMEQRTPLLGRVARRAEAWFSKAAYPLAGVVPMNAVGVFAGASRMSMSGFIAAKLVGCAVLLVAIRAASNLVQAPLLDLSYWIERNRLIVFAVSASLIGLTIWAQRRAGGTEIDHLVRMDEEIAELDVDTD